MKKQLLKFYIGISKSVPVLLQRLCLYILLQYWPTVFTTDHSLINKSLLKCCYSYLFLNFYFIVSFKKRFTSIVIHIYDTNHKGRI